MKKAYTGNASDPAQVKEAAQKVKYGREQELNDVRTILATREGLRFMWRYLTECGIFKTSMTGSSQTFFLEGRRDVGLRLLADVNEADPEAYFRMLSEDKKSDG